MTRTVVDKMNDLLRDKKSRGYSLLHELARLKLIAASLTADGVSAVLYFHLRTLEDLIHLYDLMQCHQLKSFVESVFNNLLPPSETKQKLAPLKWSNEEYEGLQQYLLGMRTCCYHESNECVYVCMSACMYICMHECIYACTHLFRFIVCIACTYESIIMYVSY